MKKRFSVIFIFLAFILTIGCFCSVKNKTAFALQKKAHLNSVCKSAYLCDQYNKTVVFSHNETAKHPIASMCKIMTLLLCFEQIEEGNIALNDDVVVSERASGMGGSQVFLETNGVYKVDELLKSITVASANDACVAMAEKICGTEESFVSKMNEKASELNMNNTVFTNCTGLPKPGQFSCAKDVAVMFSELIKHEDYFKFSTIWMDEIHHSEGRVTQISNTNKLVKFYNGCDCGKTGYTSESGHCIAASAKRNNTRVIAVVISAPDSKTRFKEVSDMFNFVFANYTNKLILDNNTPLSLEVKVKGGKKELLEVIAENSVYIFTAKNEKHSYDVSFNAIDSVKAPILKGRKLGDISIFENGIEIARVSIIANENIESATFFDSISNVIKNWTIF